MDSKSFRKTRTRIALSSGRCVFIQQTNHNGALLNCPMIHNCNNNKQQQKKDRHGNNSVGSENYRWHTTATRQQLDTTGVCWSVRSTWLDLRPCTGRGVDSSDGKCNCWVEHHSGDHFSANQIFRARVEVGGENDDLLCVLLNLL